MKRGNVKAASVEPANSYSTIPDAVAAQVQLAPDRDAVWIGGKSLTYGNLALRASRLTQYLVNNFGCESEPICLILEKSPTQVVGFLAILGAGKFVVPLSASDPPSHLKDVLEQISPRLVFADTAMHGPLRKAMPLGCRMVDPSTCLEDRDLSPFKGQPALSPTSLATVLFTSGSTGRPKGVMQTHQNWLHVIRRYSSALQLGTEDRLFRPGSFGFAAGVRALLGSLTHGATLLSESHGDIDDVLTHLVAQRATLLHTPVNLFRLLLDSNLSSEELRNLRCIFVAGDALRSVDAKRFLSKYPKTPRLIHALALTECSTIRQCVVDKDLPLAEDFTPVGYPVEDVEILLLDDHRRKVPQGEQGQIAVRSPYLSPGYWHRPDLTREFFIADPEGSEDRVYLTGDLGELRGELLIHLGRQDSKTKISGYQVDPRAVANALSSVVEVGDCAVLLEERNGEKELLALVVADAGASPTSRLIRNRLAEVLPEYMIPPTIVFVDEIPRNAHGKPDLARLGPLHELRHNRDAQYVAPRTATEVQLTLIWQEVLGIARIGIHDDLFDLGAHSLLVAATNARVRSDLGIEIPLRLIYERPCIAELSAEIDSREAPSPTAIPTEKAFNGHEAANINFGLPGNGMDEPAIPPPAHSASVAHVPSTVGETLIAGAGGDVTKVVIYGNGSMAGLRYAELFHDSDFEIVAFTVDKDYLKEDEFLGLPVVPFEEVDTRFPPLSHRMIVAVGHTQLNQLRADRCRLSKEMGYELVTFISPRASVCPGVVVGENCRVGSLSVIQPGARIGNNVLIGDASAIGHDVSIEDNCFISIGVTIAGRTKVGRSSFLGAGAVLRDGINIGPRSVIGAGAVVLESTQEGDVLVAAGAEKLSVKSGELKF